jgi:hypothetical protein
VGKNIKVADYIRYAWILRQVIIFPIAITGCYFTIKPRPILNEMKPKKKGKENFNPYLLRKLEDRQKKHYFIKVNKYLKKP